MPTIGGGGIGQLHVTQRGDAYSRASTSRGRASLELLSVGHIPLEPNQPTPPFPWRIVRQSYAQSLPVQARSWGRVITWAAVNLEPNRQKPPLRWLISQPLVCAGYRQSRQNPGKGQSPRYWPVQVVPFSQLFITSVNPPLFRIGQVFLSWNSTAPAGTWYQVYINGALVWSGQRTSVTVPLPAGPVRVDIGTVPLGYAWTSLAAFLPPVPARRTVLSWLGGTYSAANLAGFHVYGSSIPGDPVNYAEPLATITAYPSGIYTDGFGLGGFGQGGFGQGSSSYSWTSAPLSAGQWSFGIRPFNAAGNEGTAQTATVTIAAPPRAPAGFGTTQARLQYTYASGTRNATLNWNPSPQ